MEYLTPTDLAHLVLFAQLKEKSVMDINQVKPRLQTDVACRLAEDINRGSPSDALRADYQRIQRLARER